MASANLGFCTSLLTGPSPMSIKSHHSNIFFTSSSLFSQGKKRTLVSNLSRAVVCTASKPVTAVSEAETTKARIPRGITKARPISPAMQEFLGVAEIPRTQALKQIWAYIKLHNLQDPQDKKIIVCDDKLKKIFADRERVGFLEVAGLINPHFIK